MDELYEIKYLKYKEKYVLLKQQKAGMAMYAKMKDAAKASAQKMTEAAKQMTNAAKKMVTPQIAPAPKGVDPPQSQRKGVAPAAAAHGVLPLSPTKPPADEKRLPPPSPATQPPPPPRPTKSQGNIPPQGKPPLSAPPAVQKVNPPSRAMVPEGNHHNGTDNIKIIYNLR